MSTDFRRSRNLCEPGIRSRFRLDCLLSAFASRPQKPGFADSRAEFMRPDANLDHSPPATAI
jgi:hypothetical protein